MLKIEIKFIKKKKKNLFQIFELFISLKYFDMFPYLILIQSGNIANAIINKS